MVNNPLSSTSIPIDFPDGQAWVAQPVTFTPFASVRACSARCGFCSEALVRRNQGWPAASFRPGADYHRSLADCVALLARVHMGLSMSGLEAADDAGWMEQTLSVLAAHPHWTTRVLYSNGNGFCGPERDRLVSALLDFGWTRIEFSRHAADTDRNAGIMRFRKGTLAGDGPRFEAMVADVGQSVPARLVCIVQREGVCDADGVRRYLDWAHRLGVRDVVFRELSKLSDRYEPNRTARFIRRNRVDVNALLASVLSHANWTEDQATEGYYYANRCFWRDDMRITFEASDYNQMHVAHDGGVVRKLVFFANGTLCGDWDPNTQVLWRAG